MPHQEESLRGFFNLANSILLLTLHPLRETKLLVTFINYKRNCRMSFS